MSIKSIASSVVLVLSLFASTGSAAAEQFEWIDVPRIVAVGDVHGAYGSLVELLQGVGLIDQDLRWIGDDTHLVSLGDLLDRGDGTRPVLDLFMSLESQAQAVGGRVHVLLGNHEVMNLAGDWQDVTAADIDSFQPPPAQIVEAAAQRRQAFSREGHYGAWLLQQPVIIKLNDILFTHGGLPAMLLDSSIVQINEDTSQVLSQLMLQGEALAASLPAAAPLNLLALAAPPATEQTVENPAMLQARQLAQNKRLSEYSPMWYRGTSLCHGLIEYDVTAAVLKHYEASAVVVGHSPTWNHQVRQRLGGRVWVADTGMLTAVYKGQPLALDIVGSQRQVLDSSGRAVAYEREPFEPTTASFEQIDIMSSTSAVPLAEQPGPKRLPPFHKDVLVSLQDDDGDEQGRAWFRPLSKKSVKKEIAAWRLDRRLGVAMVPATVAATVQGKRGILQWSGTPIVTEQLRQDRKLNFINWCERGKSYQVVTAFDALIDQRARSVVNLAYENRLTRIRLMDHGKVFSTSKALSPSAATRYLSRIMRQRLQALTQADLTTLLADVLSKREISALLSRRDRLLQWPEIPAS